MFKPKSLAFRVDYPTKVNILLTRASLFAVSAPSPNKSIVVNAIWDTGATHSVITPEVAQKLNLYPIDEIKIVGVNSEGIAQISIVHIALPNSVLLQTRRVTIANIGGDADMLIGMDIISRGDFLICNADNKTTFSFVMPPFPDKPDWIELSSKINQQQSGVPPKTAT
jgi:predicted aspartyl protease